MCNFKNWQQCRTYKEIVEILNKHGKCAVERPVGFGKTWLFSKISSLYKKVLFIVPTKEIERTIDENYEDMRCPDAHFHTYYGVGRKWKRDLLDDILNGGYDLIVLDELHCAGANQAKNAIKIIMPKLKAMGVHVLGGTATNDRMDGYDPVKDIFEGIQPFRYTMDDMLNDGLAPKPHYTYTTLEIKDVKKYINGILQSVPYTVSSKLFADELKAVEKALAVKTNAADTIREAVYQVIPQDELEYLKFVLYFPSCAVLDEKMPEMVEAFIKAFPQLKVNDPLTITHRREDAKNDAKLDKRRFHKGRVDLVGSINKLNLGYHVPDLTGVCLLRLTDSAIIGKQQAYRPIYVGASRPGIVVDFVDSLHKPFLFMDSSYKPRKQTASGLDPLRGLHVVNVVLHDKTATVAEMLQHLENVASELTAKEVREYFNMSGMSIDLITKKFPNAVNRSRVCNILLEAGMIDRYDKRLMLYGKLV